jgi:leucyl-tRNA synthetase
MTKGDAENFLKILAPFAPHIAEELWANLRVDQRIDPRKSASIFDEQWPEYDEKLIKKDKIELVIQVNGKVRDKIEVSADISEKETKKLALSTDRVKTWLNNQEPKKIIFVKNKLINIVV